MSAAGRTLDRTFADLAGVGLAAGGGAYDGPLGVISAFAAIDALRASRIEPAVPLAVVNFCDEEGARVGACVELRGEGNHAGTTPLSRRRDPMLELAELIAAARAVAERHGALATVGKVAVEPGGLNAIASRVTAWIDARAASEEPLRAVVGAVGTPAGAARPPGPRAAPIIATGAGHDAGIRARAGVPTAMLFVRNPTGVSHRGRARGPRGLPRGRRRSRRGARRPREDWAAGGGGMR